MKSFGKPKRQVRLAKMIGQYQRALKKMIEQLVPIVIAAVTGGGVLINRMHNRMHTLDSRVDKLELRMVESFVPKTEFSQAMERVELHMLRIEEKLDKLVDKKCSS